MRTLAIRTASSLLAAILAVGVVLVIGPEAEARQAPPGTWTTRVLPTVERSAVRCHARVQVRPGGSYVRCAPVRLNGAHR